MRPEDLQVTLRPRSSWEAVELGMMLVRQHARALWLPWLVLSLPVFALLNALGWWIDHIWLAGVLMWWLLPVFDRIPLYVLSRAVFGQVPGGLDTLRAWPKVGPGYIGAHLLWRRFSPWRALDLSVDLLEDGGREDKRQRRNLIRHRQRGVGFLLIWLCQWFVLCVTIGAVILAASLVPVELLSESVSHMLETLFEDPPPWFQVLMNAVGWLGFSLIEPFYIGAGFGLYLNRRVQLEGWDIELTLRSLRTHVRDLAAPLALAACLVLAAPPLMAQDHGEAGNTAEQDTDEKPPIRLDAIFGPDGLVDVDDADDFSRAVAEASHDPLLHRQKTDTQWVRKVPLELDIPDPDFSVQGLGSTLAGIGKVLLWLLLAGLVALLTVTAPRWWPWMRRRARPKRRESVLAYTPEAMPEPALPADISARARALWHAGERRQALALLYLGSLGSVAAYTGTELPAAATEGECLHLAQHLQAPEQRHLFTHLVHIWQRAAYARRWPQDAEFMALSAALAQQFRWRA